MKLHKKKSMWILTLSTFFLGACSSITPAPTSMPVESANIRQPTETVIATSPMPTETSATSSTETMTEEENTISTMIPTEVMSDLVFANIRSVAMSGSENAYIFTVEIRSPDIGCEQYADWWEVITEDGELLYRRILAHSHVGEQPFTRSGGPVTIGPDDIVIVRAHMYPNGYGGTAFRGSVNGVFEEIQLEANFAPALESIDPLPNGCAF